LKKNNVRKDKMTNNLQLAAEIRNNVGKNISRRLRHEGNVPAIIYGIGKKPEALTLKHNEVIKALENEDFFTQIISLNVNGKPEQVVLKDLQRHPYRATQIMHIDFMRIKAGEKITMRIPLHFIGEQVAPGIKLGGIITHSISEVEVKCLPSDLPKYIDVDMSNMELNNIVHMSDLKLPKGVELTELTHGEEHNLPIATLQMARIAEEVVVEEKVVAEEEKEAEAKEEKGKETEAKE
jgi:large subunit ribosomal protein L25